MTDHPAIRLDGPPVIEIRDALESDAPGIRDVIVATYGEYYPYGQFYDADVLRRKILGEDTVLLVAEDVKAQRIVGCASVIVEIGAFSDLVGEFGRLAVLPERRGLGIGNLLMRERLRRVRDRLHVGIADSRVTHTYSQLIALKHGFVPVGFCPLKDRFEMRESTVLLAQWFGESLALRKNNPRIIPEVHALASVAMENARLPVDCVVDHSAAPYPHVRDFEIDRLTTTGYSTLLRMERGRVRNREIFGPLRLHYGFFQLRARQAEYLIARRGVRIAGAVGYIHDDVENIVRIFELISRDDEAIQFLLSDLERRCRGDMDVAYIEIDVRADAPRMQRTLLELDFVPVAYIPAMVFHDVERHDIVRMARVLVPLDLGPLELVPETRIVADLVLKSLAHQQIVPVLAPTVRPSGLLHGLTDEQTARVAGICRLRHFEPGDCVFRQDTPGDALYLVLEGTIDVALDDAPVGSVEGGEALGEMGLLEPGPHTAGAIARSEVRAAVATFEDLNRLIRRRPDVGAVLYRNLARGLGRKLGRTDRARVT